MTCHLSIYDTLHHLLHGLIKRWHGMHSGYMYIYKHTHTPDPPSSKHYEREDAWHGPANCTYLNLKYEEA